MATDICVRFGRRLQQIRRAKHINQIDLAVHTGVARTYISSIENGKQEICLRTIEILAQGLGVPVSYLFKGL
jgi:transcriptional regulator with XRE-family HTH domain